jgi:hypothetical protein
VDIVAILYTHEIDIATGYGLDCPGSVPGMARFFLQSVHPGSAAHPATYAMDTGGSLSGGKAKGGGQADH